MKIEKYAEGIIGYGFFDIRYSGGLCSCFETFYKVVARSPSTSDSAVTIPEYDHRIGIRSLVVFDGDTHKWREYFTGAVLEEASDRHSRNWIDADHPGRSSWDDLLVKLGETTYTATQFQAKLSEYKEHISYVVSSINEMSSNSKALDREIRQAIQKVKDERTRKESGASSVEAKLAAGFGSGYAMAKEAEAEAKREAQRAEAEAKREAQRAEAEAKRAEAEAKRAKARANLPIILAKLVYWLCAIACVALIVYEWFGPNKGVPKYLPDINETLLKLYIATGIAALCAGFVSYKDEIGAYMGLSMLVVPIAAAVFVFVFSGDNYARTVNSSPIGFAFTRLGIYAAAVLVPYGIGCLIGKSGNKQ